jgi:hypothetical protein
MKKGRMEKIGLLVMYVWSDDLVNSLAFDNFLFCFEKKESDRKNQKGSIKDNMYLDVG